MTSVMQKIANLAVLHISRMLSGDHHIGDADGLPVLIDYGDLALRVGPEPVRLAALADAGESASQPVREHDRRWHQFRRFIAGVAEHQALVACALLGVAFSFRRLLVHALRDIRRTAR